MSSKLYKFLPGRTCIDFHIGIFSYILAIKLSDMTPFLIVKIY